MQGKIKEEVEMCGRKQSRQLRCKVVAFNGRVDHGLTQVEITLKVMTRFWGAKSGNWGWAGGASTWSWPNWPACDTFRPRLPDWGMSNIFIRFQNSCHPYGRKKNLPVSGSLPSGRDTDFLGSHGSSQNFVPIRAIHV
jgi:hypothetical protein